MFSQKLALSDVSRRKIEDASRKFVNIIALDGGGIRGLVLIQVTIRALWLNVYELPVTALLCYLSSLTIADIGPSGIFIRTINLGENELVSRDKYWRYSRYRSFFG